MKLPNKVYDILKWVCIICLPAIATFYGVLADAWGWPASEPIIRSINALATLIGILIGASSFNYAFDKSGKDEQDNGLG